MCGMLIHDFIAHVVLIVIFCFGIIVCYKYSSLGRPKKEQHLPLDIQLKVLKKARKTIEIAPHTYYLCIAISDALFALEPKRNYHNGDIPVFCRKNAILYGNARNAHLCWWPLTLAGKEDRIKFLDWCISQVELQIKYETQKNKRFYHKWFK